MDSNITTLARRCDRGDRRPESRFLWAPFLMCLVLTGIHAYLGVHVLAREVVFVDIAMAQIAAMGATVAFLVGHDPDLAVLRLRAGRHHRGCGGPGAQPEPAPARLAGGGDRRRLRGVLCRGGAGRRPRARTAPSRCAACSSAICWRWGLWRWPGSPASMRCVGLVHWLCRRPLLPDLGGSGRRLRPGVARAAVGLRVLRLVRRGGGQLRPRRRRVAGVLLPDRAGAGRRHAGRIGPLAPADRLGVRHAWSASSA